MSLTQANPCSATPMPEKAILEQCFSHFYQMSCLASLLLRLIRSPYRYRINGMGMKTMDKNPSKLLAQSTPKRRYMAFANSGKAAPNADLTRSLPA